MLSYFKLAGVVAGMMLLAGCTGQALYGAQRIQPTGSDFAQNLYSGYIDLAEDEYAEGDYSDSDVFARRAVAVGTGSAVAPEAIESRWLPAEHVAELTDARAKLIAALDAGATEKDPARAAQAQVMFDCWMQEQEENWQPEDIGKCRDGFMAALDTITPKIAAVSKPKPEAVRYVVYFRTDQANLDAAAEAVIAEAKAAAAKIGGAVVRISGNADRVGPDQYNVILSEMRAAAVAKLMAVGDVPIKAVYTEAFGEAQPAIMTADETPEPLNRRVEIIIQP